MGVFLDYFKKTLRFLPILKPGAIAMLCDGGASVMDAARSAVIWLRDQFHPERCDDASLERFAASRGITRFEYETTQQYFYRVKWAYRWYVTGGREEGMLWILRDGCGIDNLEIINLRDENPARWAEFAIRAPNIAGLAMMSLPSIEWAINIVKPARSKFAEMRPELNLVATKRYYGASGFLSGAAMYIFPMGVGVIILETAYARRPMTTYGGANTAVFPKT